MRMKWKSSWLSLLLGLLLVFPAAAQTPQPSYRLRPNGPGTISGSDVVVSVTILNTGSPATQTSAVTVSDARTSEELAREQVPPLASNEDRVILLSFPIASLENAGGSVSLLVRLVPDSAGEILAANDGRTSVSLPAPGTPNETAATAIPPNPNATAVPPLAITPVPAFSTFQLPFLEQTRFPIPGTDLELDLENPLHIGLLIGLAGILLIFVWMFTVILRLLFQQPPTMSAWQPPYALMPVLDPNSSAGRRQLWQPHAQNDALVGPCAPDNYHIRKLVLGTDGATLAGWHVTGLRLSQYDMYGRVTRSQVIAPASLVRQLDRLARRGPKLDTERATRAARPIAARLVRTLAGRLSKQNAMLALALDVRLRGTHGDVRILFELYGCNAAGWMMVDQWEPEVIVMNGSILENFTYTLYGKRPDETMKQFRKRLFEEIARGLGEMVTRSVGVTNMPSQQQEPAPPLVSTLPQDTAQHPKVTG